jgi:hypothetical protein
MLHLLLDKFPDAHYKLGQARATAIGRRRREVNSHLGEQVHGLQDKAEEEEVSERNPNFSPDSRPARAAGLFSACAQVVRAWREAPLTTTLTRKGRI